MTDEHPPKGILFLGVANSARSQMAEGLARLSGPLPPAAVYSAGSEPASVNLLAVRVRLETCVKLPMAPDDAVLFEQFRTHQDKDERLPHSRNREQSGRILPVALPSLSAGRPGGGFLSASC
ncbi:MAG: hypothetical protein ACREMD_00815 [Gemmatimonadota bacterium]